MLFHFNMKKTYDTVDGRNPANQLRLVVEIPLFTGFQHHPRWCRISAINSMTPLKRAVCLCVYFYKCVYIYTYMNVWYINIVCLYRCWVINGVCYVTENSDDSVDTKPTPDYHRKKSLSLLFYHPPSTTSDT